MSKLKIGSKLEDNLKCDGLSIDKSGYSTHRRLTSNLSYINSDRQLFKQENYLKNEAIITSTPSNYNSLNCNLELTKIKDNIISPKSINREDNKERKFNISAINLKEPLLDFKKKYTGKLVDKIKNSSTQSRNDNSSNNNNNNNNLIPKLEINKKVEKKILKNEIFKKDQQKLSMSRQTSSKMNKTRKNSQLVFRNPEEVNLDQSKNKVDLFSKVKFKQNNLITKFQALK